MKKILVTCLSAAMSLAGCRVASGQPEVSFGTLHSYEKFPSKYVPRRTVRVWTPEGYDSSKRYDVLYMHDGQMLWDANVSWNHQEWGVDEVVSELLAAGAIRDCIVVGVDNNEKRRIGEFSPEDVSIYLKKGDTVYKKCKSRGNAYLKFLVEEVKPFVDKNFSTNTGCESTFIMGSSCGGLISLYALCKYPEVFGGAACLSTHCTFSSPSSPSPKESSIEAFLRYLADNLPADGRHLLYMDRGDATLDAAYEGPQEKITSLIKGLQPQWSPDNFKYEFFPGAAHCEDDWRARLDIPLTFLLGK